MWFNSQATGRSPAMPSDQALPPVRNREAWRFLDEPGLICLFPLVHLLGFQDGPTQERQLAVAKR
jgi:hypothetical protein